MPCTYYESPEEKREAAKKARDRRHVELDKVTDLLCSVLRAVEDCRTHATVGDLAHTLFDIKGLPTWWSEHKKRDAKND